MKQEFLYFYLLSVSLWIPPAIFYVYKRMTDNFYVKMKIKEIFLYVLLSFIPFNNLLILCFYGVILCEYILELKIYKKFIDLMNKEV